MVKKKLADFTFRIKIFFLNIRSSIRSIFIKHFIGFFLSKNSVI